MTEREEKRRATMVAKHGSWDNYVAALKANGSQGGKAKVPKGFALSGKAKEASIKGHQAKRDKNANNNKGQPS